MLRRSLAVHALPFLPAVLGLAVSVERFRAGHPLAGGAAACAGLLVMVFVVFLLPESAGGGGE